MSVLDKLFFWKKEESPAELTVPDLPAGPGLSAEGMSMPHEEQPPSLGEPMPGQPEQMTEPSMPEPRMGPSTFGSHARPELEQVPPPQVSGGEDLSLISAKLDTIKAQLDAVLQRLERMEYSKEDRSYQKRWR
jgi:hypothetical protein